MEQSLLQKVKEQLLRHDGLKLKPYRCPAGKLTIARNGFQMILNQVQDCGLE